MLVGFEAEADCELSCEKLRVEDVLKTAASGVILELASGREFASNLDAVEATRRVRDAIVSLGVSDDDGYAEREEVPPASAKLNCNHRPRLHNPSSTTRCPPNSCHLSYAHSYW